MSQIQQFHWFTDHSTIIYTQVKQDSKQIYCSFMHNTLRRHPTKPSPSKCNSCKTSLKSNSLTLTCNDCNKPVHIKCGGISRHEFSSTYRNLDTWHCSDCSAPCGICHRDVLNNHKAIHCEHYPKWIHTQCCAIDDSEYKQVIHLMLLGLP